MTEYLTVVYTINDPESFAAERQKITDQMEPSAGKPWAITAMSCDHEMHRLSLIEEAMNDNDMSAIELALSSANVGNFKTIDELCKAEDERINKCLTTSP